jgi:hypothetical protein
MFTLQTEDGTTLLMKNGKPFEYSTRTLAKLGQKFIEGDRKITLKIVGK